MSLVDGVAIHRLKNGLTVLTREIHFSPLVTIWMWYKVGSRKDRKSVV